MAPSNAAATPKPFNQKIRYWALRLAILALLPLIVMVRSAWAETAWAMALLQVLGTLLVVAAVLYRFWAILYIGGRKNREIVQEGPYSMCRHPLYFGTTLGALGLGLMLGSVVMAVLLAVLSLVVLSATAAREERFLRAEFAPHYDTYAARVPRILPRLALFRTAPEVVFGTYTLRTNAGDALAFLMLFPAVAGIDLLHHYGLVGRIVLP